MKENFPTVWSTAKAEKLTLKEISMMGLGSRASFMGMGPMFIGKAILILGAGSTAKGLEVGSRKI